MRRHTSVLTLLSVLGACAYNPDLVSADRDSDESSTAGESGNPGPGSGVSATTTADTDDTADTSGAGPTTDPTSADSTGPSDSTGPEAEGSSGPAVVPCAGNCVAPAAGDWTGPFRLETSDVSDPVPECGDGWDLAVTSELFEGIEASSAECGCSCGAAQGVTCTGTTRTLQRWDNLGGNCNALSTSSYQLNPGGCIAFSPTLDNDRWQNSGPTPMPQGGSCLGVPSSAVEDAAFSTRYTLCGEGAPPEGECAEAGQCVNSSDRPLCLMAEGDLQCPGDGFEVKRVVYADLSDTRGCSNDCSCGAPEGTCSAAGSLQLRTGGCGSGVQPVLLPMGSCVSVASAIASATYPAAAVPVPTTSCTPSQPTPTGEVTGTGATTLCCTG